MKALIIHNGYYIYKIVVLQDNKLNLIGCYGSLTFNLCKLCGCVVYLDELQTQGTTKI